MSTFLHTAAYHALHPR